jgi:hypothetical protein
VSTYDSDITLNNKRKKKRDGNLFYNLIYVERLPTEIRKKGPFKIEEVNKLAVPAIFVQITFVGPLMHS